jgi:hypothetical protein
VGDPFAYSKAGKSKELGKILGWRKLKFRVDKHEKNAIVLSDLVEIRGNRVK